MCPPPPFSFSASPPITFTSFPPLFLRCVGSQLADSEREYVTSLLLELCQQTPPTDEASLSTLIESSFEGTNVDDVDDVVERVMDELRLKGLAFAEPDMADLDVAVDDKVMAVLNEDSEWHEAVVKAYLGPNKFSVLFTEYGKVQSVARDELALMEDIADNDAADSLDSGVCPMCEREAKLTKHHLIPRTMHAKYIKKGFTKAHLNTCVDICRKCHSAVHRLYPEPVLAAEYDTAEKLMADPRVQKWMAYAKTSNKSTKWDMQMMRLHGKS